MKIKVCGLMDPENIKAVAALSPDYMGFIFYGPSPRFANGLNVEPLKDLPSEIQKTGVFVNEEAARINELIKLYNFNAIQLHGNEGPDFCYSFKNQVQVIKAFGINEYFDFSQLTSYIGKVDFFLFDAKTTAHGGSGKTFDWAFLNNYKLEVPFFLSGGLSPDNIAEAINIRHPQFYGVDLNSRFETAPGIKNTAQLTAAFNTINQAYTNEIRS